MEDILQILDESISYELDAHDIYYLFSQTLETDSEFWSKLADEELNHASVLRKIYSLFNGDDKIVGIISVNDLDTIKESRKRLKKLLEKFKKKPTRQLACEIGMEIEKSVIEQSYEQFMNKITSDNTINLLQALNGEEKNHLKRIEKYFQSRVKQTTV